MSRAMAYFDVEGITIPENWDRRSPLDIYCASMVIRDTLAGDPVEERILWWAGMADQDLRAMDHDLLLSGMESGAVKVNKAMSEEEVEMMLVDLIDIAAGRSRLLDSQRVSVFTWWGVGYDWPVIAAALPGRRSSVAKLARKTFDPCFQFNVKLGYPIGLTKISSVMLGEGKFEGLDGAHMTSMWPLNAADVIRYNIQDCMLTAGVVEAIMVARGVQWVTNSHKITSKKMDKWMCAGGWATIARLMGEPDPNRSWMSDYSGDLDIAVVTDWMSERSDE